MKWKMQWKRLMQRVTDETGTYIVGFLVVLIPLAILISAVVSYSAAAGFKWNDLGQASKLAMRQMETDGYYSQQANNAVFTYLEKAGIDPSKVSVTTIPPTNVRTVGTGTGTSETSTAITNVQPVGYGKPLAVELVYTMPIIIMGMKVTNPQTGKNEFPIPATEDGVSDYLP